MDLILFIGYLTGEPLERNRSGLKMQMNAEAIKNTSSSAILIDPRSLDSSNEAVA
jgi:hypothetical protein